MYVVSHTISYEGTTVIAICDNIEDARRICNNENKNLNRYSTDMILIHTFIPNVFYELGVCNTFSGNGADRIVE